MVNGYRMLELYLSIIFQIGSTLYSDFFRHGYILEVTGLCFVLIGELVSMETYKKTILKGTVGMLASMIYLKWFEFLPKGIQKLPDAEPFFFPLHSPVLN